MGKISHIWFDFGGTLYKETSAFKEVHDAYRYRVFAELTRAKNLDDAEQKYKMMYAQHGSNSGVFRALGEPSDFWQRKLEELDFSNLLQPDPLVSNTLSQLHDQTTLSLFTNFRPVLIDKLLSQLQIPRSYFTYVLSGDDVAERKPALDGFKRMIEKSGLPPNQLLYVGDREDVDIKPAKLLGIQTCLVYGESTVADYVCVNFDELLNVGKT